MQSYLDFRQSQQEFFDKNTQGILFFAFGNEQFNKMCKDNNISEPTKELLSIGYGGFILKSRRDEYANVLKEMKEREKKFKKENSVDGIKDSIIYELENHEYQINEDALEEALESLGYPTDINKLDKKTRKALDLAIKELESRELQ